MKALTPPRLMSFMLLATLLTSVLGCVQERPETTITRLDDAEAVRLADSIRQAVSVQVAEGLELHLWASDPLVMDPNALDVGVWRSNYKAGTSTRTTARTWSCGSANGSSRPKALDLYTRRDIEALLARWEALP